MTHPLATWESRIRWLKQQAKKSYGPVDAAGYAPVLRRPGEFQSPIWPRLRDAFNDIACLTPAFPHVANNLMTRHLPELKDEIVTAIDDFFAAEGLADFEFLDHGGRALVYRAHHVPTGQTRVARIETPHRYRGERIHHPAILQAFATNAPVMDSYAGIKLEALPEQIPLNKVLLREGLYRVDGETPDHVATAAWYMAWMTNLTYPGHLFDADSDPTNVGVSPHGKIRSHDPEIRTASRAEKSHMNLTALAGRPTVRQIRLLYGA